MDKIIRTLICNDRVSLTVLQTTELVNEAIRIHKTNVGASRILGGLLTCGAYIASSLKEESGGISITVKAKDGDGAASVSSDSQLNVRGYADGSCGSTLVGGSLTVVREDGYSTPFNGTCEIESDNISDILETYYGQSEQIPTAAAIYTEFDGSGACVWAGGVVMQLLPDADEQSIQTAGDLFERYKNSGAKSRADDARRIYKSVFASFASGDVTEIYPQYKCNCARKMPQVLASVGKAELIKICEEQGEVRVHCHYCNRDYIYDKETIEGAFK